MSLPSANRFSLKDSRGKFFASEKSLYSPLMQIVVIKQDVDSPLPQFAVSVSKKVAKKAHDRNLIRRQIQQLILENISTFPPYKYLFLPKKTPNATFLELKDSFTVLLSKLKL